MSTTARIYFVNARADLPKDQRIHLARHQPADAVLWVESSGTPHTPSKEGLLDDFARFLEHSVPKPSCGHARRLAGEFVAWTAQRQRYGALSIYPTVPTLGAIASYEYLVICQGPSFGSDQAFRDAPAPVILMRQGHVWQTPPEFGVFVLSDRPHET